METLFKQKILEICQELNINKQEFIHKLDSTRTTVHNIETGKVSKPSPDFLAKLEVSLGINRNWFLGKSDVMFLNTLPPTNGASGIPPLWEDLKIQYEARIRENEKRIQELEFVYTMWKAEKMKDPVYSNFLQPHTNKGKVVKFGGAFRQAGATCGVVAYF